MLKKRLSLFVFDLSNHTFNTLLGKKLITNCLSIFRYNSGLDTFNL